MVRGFTLDLRIYPLNNGILESDRIIILTLIFCKVKQLISSIHAHCLYPKPKLNPLQVKIVLYFLQQINIYDIDKK